MNPLSTSIPRCKAVSSEEEGGEGTPYTHTHTTRRMILCRICLVVCLLLLLLLLLTWHHQEKLRLAACSLHPCPCAAAAYQANKVHCLFAVFAAHVCLLNCQRFWLFWGRVEREGCLYV